jgi:hypothetical protein
MSAHNAGPELDQAIGDYEYTARWAGPKSIYYYASKARVQLIADGETDDTEALQAALELAVADEATVYFPPGDFGISDTILTLDGDQSLNIIGAGIGRTFLRALEHFPSGDTGSNAVFVIEGTSSNRQSGFHCSHLQLAADDHNVRFARFKYAGESQLEHLEFRNVNGTAIYAESWWDSTVRNCDFANGGTNGTARVRLIDSITAEGLDSGTCNNIVFMDCRFESPDGNGGTGINIGVRNRDNKILLCKFEGINKGITFSDDARANRVRDCDFRHLGSHAISGEGGIWWNICGNHFDGNGGDNINLDLNANLTTKSVICENIFDVIASSGSNITAADASNVIENNREDP